jgi:radical SAM protein (TIGR01212 family)
LTPQRRYRAFSSFLRERFGTRVYRISLDAGLTCPNRDGTMARGGCIYCNNSSFSPNRRVPPDTIRNQVSRGMAQLQKRYHALRFLAYFQAGTNTHAPVATLRRLYNEALDLPQVLGLLIGTRPDCVPDPVLDLVQSYVRDHYVSLELGLQSIHDRTLDWMNRGHHLDAFLDAVQRCQGRGFDLCAHVIIGLPGESNAQVLATAETLARLPIQAVKVHNLHIVRNTPLENLYQAGQVRLLERDEYIALVCDFLERLPPAMVIQRLGGEAPPDYLVAPRWCLDKQGLLNAIDREFSRRDSWQGIRACG